MKYLLSTNLSALYRKKRRRRRLGQYNSNNKLIHGQYTSRYNLHHTHAHTHTHTHIHTHITASQMLEFTEKGR